MRGRKGFTLIELLVVIAIIAILAAILFPVFAGAKERARQSTCCSNLKQLMMSIREYCDDHNGRMPPCIQYGNVVPDWAGDVVCGQAFHVRNGAIWNYVRTKNVYVCPTDIYFRGGIPNWELSYSMNFQMGSNFALAATDPKHSLILDVESAGRTAKVLILIHERRDRINDGYFAWGNNIDIPSDVHYSGTTLVYADTHAKWGSYNALMVQMNSNQWYGNSELRRLGLTPK